MVSTGIDKWSISLQAAVVFAVIASPVVYRFTGRLHETAPGPIHHLLLHAFIYMCIVRSMMGSGDDPQYDYGPDMLSAGSDAISSGGDENEYPEEPRAPSSGFYNESPIKIPSGFDFRNEPEQPPEFIPPVVEWEPEPYNLG